ncbi:MAG: GspE/PulE family protein [Erysipelotrichaceae bacterium]|nr:GspE/PulE family protein [Erysipelotrichaceae bacterium]
MKNKRLGEMLVDAHVLSQDKVEEAVKLQANSGKRLGAVLLENGYITETQLIDVLKIQLGIDFIDVNKETIDPSMASIVPKSIAEQYHVVPIKLEKDKLILAMEDPLNFRALEAVKQITKYKVTPYIAYASAVERAILVLYENEGASIAIEQMKQERGIDATFEEVAKQSDVTSKSSAAPTVKLVNSILERSLAEGASDIHIEPRENDMIVRIRVDGRLNQMLTIPKGLQDAVISRFKIMSEMNITEHRIPQDGRAQMTSSDGNVVDLRLSSLPTIYGEKIVIRILTRDKNSLTRTGIGITEKDNERFSRILKNSSGLIMIVGPTGSGKTSTLYTMIEELKSETVNMISLEDPVEFQIEGVTQVAINEKIGLTFASALRSCLRQDPDIISIGEIRDGETASIALRAAMTGHLVLTTVHTEDAVSAIDRLRDLGVEPYLIGGSLRGIVSQRLVRKICPNCREEYTPDPEIIDLAGINPLNKHFYKGKGCYMCFDSGYKGRTGVFEILTIDSFLRDQISKGINGNELRKLVSERGSFTPMIVNGRDLVEKGVTTVDEIVDNIVTVE